MLGTIAAAFTAAAAGVFAVAAAAIAVSLSATYSPKRIQRGLRCIIRRTDEIAAICAARSSPTVNRSVNRREVRIPPQSTTVKSSTAIHWPPLLKAIQLGHDHKLVGTDRFKNVVKHRHHNISHQRHKPKTASVFRHTSHQKTQFPMRGYLPLSVCGCTASQSIFFSGGGLGGGRPNLRAQDPSIPVRPRAPPSRSA